MFRHSCTLPLLLILVLLSVIGCQDGEDTTPIITDDPGSYYDLSEKEHVVLNLNKCNLNKDIDQYKALLHPDYTHHGVDSEVIIPRETDISGTEHLYTLERFIAEVGDGTWEELTEYNGQVCDDCWETTRLASLAYTAEGKDYSFKTRLKLIIRPESGSDPKTYKLFSMIDLGKVE